MKYRLTVFKQRIALIAFLFSVTLLTSPLCAQNGQFGYDLVASSGTFTSIANAIGSTRLGVIETDEAISSVINIGFPFHYYGQQYTQLKVGSNGFVVFDPNVTFTAFTNSLTIAYPVIAPLWDDMSGNVGQSTYLTSGTAPNRVFTVEWLNWKWHKSAIAAGISFQLKLYEGTNKIEFIYRRESGALITPSATIGITGGSKNLYSLGNVTSQPSLRPGGYDGISAKPATGQVYSFVTRTEDFTIPTVQATNVTAGLQGNKTVIKWTNGNGQYRAVFIKEVGVGGDLVLANNIHYGASGLNNGPSIINGWYCVYNNAGSEAYITPLSSTKNYLIQVVEYSGQGHLQKYNTSASTNNPIIHGNKTNQSITFLPIGTVNFNNGPLTLTATASSGLPVSYVSSNLSVATISGNTVTLVAAGTTVITASQTGNENYSAAQPVTQMLTVTDGSQTITFPAITPKKIDDAPFTLNATASSGLPVQFTSSNTSIVTISGNTATIIGAGTVEITASQPGNAQYNAAVPVSQMLTVNKLLQTITFPAIAPKKIDDAPFALSASASSGLPVQFTSGNTSIITISGNTATIIGAGTVEITASQPGDAQYNAATPVVQVLTVNKLSQTITFQAIAPKKIDDAPFTLNASASSGLPVQFTSSNTSVVTISGNTATIMGAGTITITASQPGDAQYNAATPVVQVLTVAKLSQTITFQSIGLKKIDDAPFTLNASASSGLPVQFTSGDTSIVTISGNTATILGTGTVQITASQPGSAQYNSASPVSQLLTVNKLSQTITFAPLPTAISGAPLELIATVSSGLPVSFSVSASIPDSLVIATISGNTLTPTAAGTVRVVAYQTGNDQYLGASTFQLLTIVNGRISGSASNADVEVYPNTVKDVLLIDVSHDSATTIALYNSMGTLIAQQSGQKRIEVDMRQYPSGRYMLVIQSEGRTASRHIIKE
jgi:hypothetical protein